MKGKGLAAAFILGCALAPAAFAQPFGNGATICLVRSSPCVNEAQAREPEREEPVIVRNRQGVALGQIVNFVVDTEIDRVAFAVLDMGGAMAVEDLRLVPVNALSLEEDGVILNMDRRRLAEAPIPETGQEPEDFVRTLSDYYGVAPYWEEEE